MLNCLKSYLINCLPFEYRIIDRKIYKNMKYLKSSNLKYAQLVIYGRLSTYTLCHMQVYYSYTILEILCKSLNLFKNDMIFFIKMFVDTKQSDTRIKTIEESCRSVNVEMQSYNIDYRVGLSLNGVVYTT